MVMPSNNISSFGLDSFKLIFKKNFATFSLPSIINLNLPGLSFNKFIINQSPPKKILSQGFSYDS